MAEQHAEFISLQHNGLQDSVISDVWSYWRGSCGDQICPARADIDPLDIPKLLPHIGLIDVLDGGQRFRYRLIGTHMNDVFGINFTGQYLDEAKEGTYAAFLHEMYAAVAWRKEPLFSESVFGYRLDRFLNIRRLILPLAVDDDSRVNMLLFSSTFQARTSLSPGDMKQILKGVDRPYRPGDIVEFEDVERYWLR